MEFQPTFEAVRDKLSHVQLSAALESFQKARKSLNAINHLEFLQGFVLLLRFGQVVATGIITLIYFYFVYQHQTHECRYWPDLYVCRDGGQRPDQVPISYVFILTAAAASFLQLFLTTLIKLRTLTFSPQSTSTQPNIRTKNYSGIEGLLLWPSDIPVAAVYVIAFICLSDFVVPSGILLGARDGTRCYSWNLQNSRGPVILRFCVLGQHGYWWSMGAMISYLITTTLYAIYSIKNSTMKQIAQAIQRGRISLTQIESGNVEETMNLLHQGMEEEALIIITE